MKVATILFGAYILLNLFFSASSRRGGGGGIRIGIKHGIVIPLSKSEGRRGGRRHRSIDMEMSTMDPQQTSLDLAAEKDGARIVNASNYEFNYAIGKKITLFCRAQGNPRPSINWFKNGIELHHQEFIEIFQELTGKAAIESKMEINPTTQKSAGHYECQADNEHGRQRVSFKVNYAKVNGSMISDEIKMTKTNKHIDTKDKRFMEKNKE